MVIRRTLVYLALFALLRLVMKRESSEVGVTNLRVIVLLADAAQNVMSARYESITDGLILVGTIIGWSYLLDWLSFRNEFFYRLIRPEKLLLVRDVRLMRTNMKEELISESDLMSELRNKGYEHPSEVSKAYIEPNGTISVIGGHTQAGGGRSRRR